jgi:hypothetical protein
VSTPLSPALDRFPREAEIIGRLLTGYTAIEYQLCMCAGMGGGDVRNAIVDLFSKRGETRRVKVAQRFGRGGYDDAGLGDQYASAIDDVKFCVKIRNQYAHCIWHNFADAGELLFANMEEIAIPPDGNTGDLRYYAVSIDILTQQEAFFAYVKDNLNYLNYKRRQVLGEIGQVDLRLPDVKARPLLHNGPRP